MQEIPRNWRIEKGICCRETDRARTSKNWWIVYASGEERYDCDSIVDSDSGVAETSKFCMSDAREFHDPESGSSSGETHVPDQTSTFLSPRTLPRCDSGLPRDTQIGTGILGNVFLNDHLLKKDYPLQSSTIQRIWHPLLRDWDLTLRDSKEEEEKWEENRWIPQLLHSISNGEVDC